MLGGGGATGCADSGSLANDYLGGRRGSLQEEGRQGREGSSQSGSNALLSLVYV